VFANLGIPALSIESHTLCVDLNTHMHSSCACACWNAGGYPGHSFKYSAHWSDPPFEYWKPHPL